MIRIIFLLTSFLINWLVSSLCQSCRSLSRMKRCPGCNTRRWIYFAEFRMCVGHDCLGTHLHLIGIRPDPYCIIRSLRKPVDINHLGQCTALLNRLTPNDSHIGRTTPLTSKHYTLYIYSTNVGTEYFKHALYSPFFLFKMQFVS